LVEFEWDEHNREHIWQRHGVTADEAEEVFEDRHLYRYGSRASDERRTIYVGRTFEGRLLAVAVTVRDSSLRVVTARDANTWEVKRYRRTEKR